MIFLGVILLLLDNFKGFPLVFLELLAILYEFFFWREFLFHRFFVVRSPPANPAVSHSILASRILVSINMYVSGVTAVITHRLTPPFLLEGVKTVINDVETMRLAAVGWEGEGLFLPADGWEREELLTWARVRPWTRSGRRQRNEHRAADKPVCLIRRRSTAVLCRAKPLIRTILCVEHTDPRRLRLCESKSVHAELLQTE